MFLELNREDYQIEGIDGEIYSFAGCSAAGQFEFVRRLVELKAYLAGKDEPTALIYRQDRRLRWLVDRCLKLNGVDPAWVNWMMIEQLLFQPALLIQVNDLDNSSDGEPVTLPQMVALVADITGSVSEAITLINTLSTQMLIDVLMAYGERSKTDEQKESERFEEWKQRKIAQAQGVTHGG